MRSLVVVLSFLFNTWLVAQPVFKLNFQSSVDKLLDNIHPAGTVSGVVVASPSKANPNYFFHWVRDAALVMNTVFDLFLREQDQGKKDHYLKLMKNYIL